MDRIKLREWVDAKPGMRCTSIEQGTKFPNVKFTVEVDGEDENGYIEVTLTKKEVYFSAEEDEEYTYSITVPTLKLIGHVCDYIQENFNWSGE